MNINKQVIDQLSRYFVRRDKDTTFGGDILPDEQDSHNIGSSSRRVNILYARSVVADNLGTTEGGGTGNADTVDGFHASTTPNPNYLIALDGSSHLPTSVYDQAVLLNGTRAMTDDLEINPGSAKAPFTLGANAQGQLVSGLNADTIDGQHASDLGGAPDDAQYLTLSTHVDLSSERVLTMGNGLAGTDAGAGSTYTVAVDLATPSGLSFSGGNLQIDDAVAGTGIGISSKVLSVGVSGLGLSTTADAVVLSSSSNPGSAASILATNSSGYLQLVRLGLGISPSYPLHIQGTSNPQFRLAYDGSNYANFYTEVDGDLLIDPTGKLAVGANLEFRQVSTISTSTGNLAISPAGDLIIDPTGDDVYPQTNYDINLGLITSKFKTLHAGELWVETLVAQETIATIGGRVLVGETNVLSAPVYASAEKFTDTTFETGVGSNLLVNGSFETAGSGGSDVFGTWAETIGSGGAILRDTSTYVDGSASAKLTQGSSDTYVSQSSISVTANVRYSLIFWTKGDGTYAGGYRVQNQNTSANIIAETSTGVTANTWTPVYVQFTPPTGCSLIRIYFYAPPGGSGQYAYFDYAYVLRSEWTNWTESYTGGYIIPDPNYQTDDFYSVRLNNISGTPYIYQDISVTASDYVSVKVKTRGDGTYAGQYRVQAVGGSDIISLTSTQITSTTWTDLVFGFTVPGGVTSARIYLYAPSTAGGSVWFDDISGQQYGIITTKYNNFASGDYVYLEAGGYFEFMKIMSSAGGAGPYTYNVARDLDRTGSNSWIAGDAVFNTGQNGEGFIDMYAISNLSGGSALGPTIVGNVRYGTAYNDYAERWAIGNLNGVFNVGTTRYGVAFGDPGATYLQIDATDGFQIFNTSTDLIGQWDTNGDFTLGRTGTEKSNVFYDFSSGELQFRTGTNDPMLYINGDGQLIAGDDNMVIDSSGITIIDQFTAIQYLDATLSATLSRIGFSRFKGTYENLGEMYLETMGDGTITQHLANYSFESGTTGWSVGGTNGTPTISQSSDYAKAGTYSMKYLWTSTSGGASGSTYYEITSGFTAGNMVLFSGYYRITNVSNMADTFQTQVLFYNATSDLLDYWASDRRIQVSTDWIYIKSTALVIPSGTTKITVRFNISGDGLGSGETITMYFDELRLESFSGSGIWLGQTVEGTTVVIGEDLKVLDDLAVTGIIRTNTVMIGDSNRWIGDEDGIVSQYGDLMFHNYGSGGSTTDGDIRTPGGISLGYDIDPGGGNLVYTGTLYSRKNTVHHAVYAYHPFIDRSSNTSWDGDSKSSTSGTNIDVTTGWSENCPDGVRAVNLRVRIDGGAAGDYIVIGNTSDVNHLYARQDASGYHGTAHGIVSVNSDDYIRVYISASSSVNVYIWVLGYFV